MTSAEQGKRARRPSDGYARPWREESHLQVVRREARRLTIAIQPGSRRCRSAHALSRTSFSCDNVQRTWVSIRSRVFSRRSPIAAMACQSTPFSAALRLAGMWDDAMLTISNSRSKASRRVRSPASSSLEIPCNCSERYRSLTGYEQSVPLPMGQLLIPGLANRSLWSP